MIVMGLTGSIGMGKSTAAAMFRDEGVPVFDADAAVHALYSGTAAHLVEALFPGVLVEGQVDRRRLATRVFGNREALRRLEAVVHPLVRDARAAFLAECRAAGAPLAVLDIPLLFETGLDAEVDATVVVSAPESVQKARVLARLGMTDERFSAIQAEQVPDAEKRRRATFVVDTGAGFAATRAAIRRVIAAVGDGATEI